MKLARQSFLAAILVFVLMAEAACVSKNVQPDVTPAQNTPVVEPVATETPVNTPPPTSPAAGVISTPTMVNTARYPIPGDLNIRRAMAYCTDKAALVQTVYPYISEQEAEKIVVDSFVPKFHWIYAGDENISLYPYDVEKGKAILDESGWTQADGGKVRQKDGKELALNLAIGQDPLTRSWAETWAQQMADCGVGVHLTVEPSDWFSSGDSGLQRGEFEAAGWTVNGGIDPAGQIPYTCDQIPSEENDWQGLNWMAWCSQAATVAIRKAGSTLETEARRTFYTTAQAEFTRDLPALPLFARTEAYASAYAMRGFAPTVGEGFGFQNVHQWTIPGRQYATVGVVNEPSSLYPRAADTLTNRLVLGMLGLRAYAVNNIDFQPYLMKSLSTIESGLAEEDEVEVQAGQKVVDISGRAVDLEEGVRVIDSTGDEVAYTSGKIKMKQLYVRYEFRNDLKWQDGSPVSQADLELGYAAACDPDAQSNAEDKANCAQTQAIKFSGLAYTVTWLPGYQSPLYFLPPYPFYPSKQPIKEGLYKGSTLGDVPVKDWATLNEVTRSPWSCGPYILHEWVKGQRMDFDANPYFFGDRPRLSKITILITKPDDAVPLLLNGKVDLLGPDSLPLLTDQLIKAGQNKIVKTSLIAGLTWDQIDFNLRKR